MLRLAAAVFMTMKNGSREVIELVMHAVTTREESATATDRLFAIEATAHTIPIRAPLPSQKACG